MVIAKASKYLVIALTVAAIALAGLTLASITVNQNVSSSGTIVAGPNVGVYSNSACTNAITSISWGSIEVGNSASQTVYIEDTGGAQMAPSITIGTISPSGAVGYITITITSPTSLPAEIQPGASNALAVTFTVTVSSSTPTSVTSFSNTITISGTG
ncbi:MAG TPA: hypothetical protein VK536_05470 [Candidatus Limnocylindrales bacterium]|nr:hypothetical protein [Candidatus Limnocylindrales bacterium]